MSAEPPIDPETVADVGRDTVALLRALVDEDWGQRADIILNGAEHSGTLRGVTDTLLGLMRQSFIRHVLGAGIAEEGTEVWMVLNGDVEAFLANPRIRESLDHSIAEMQARIIAADQAKDGFSE